MRVVQLRQIQNSRTTTAFANPSDAIVDATFHLLGINKSLLSVLIFGNMQISGDKSSQPETRSPFRYFRFRCFFARVEVKLYNPEKIYTEIFYIKRNIM